MNEVPFKPQTYHSASAPKSKIWPNIVLFVLTVGSTFIVGLTWSVSFLYSDIITKEQQSLQVGMEIFAESEVLSLSIIYVLVLLGILTGHELGHFLMCRYYGLKATLPYFIPAPTLIGTLGAFIKIKSPISRKRQLFDIGVAGPMVSFILSVPALIIGLSLSKVVSSVPEEGSLIFGEPLILKLISVFMFRGIPEGYDIVLHPVAFAGWVGLLVTAFNLFPVGQLDGGHVIYALVGDRSRKMVPLFILLFVFMGFFFWIGWFLWALIIVFLGLKHPRILDEEAPISKGRKILGGITFIVFIISFIPDPIKGYTFFDLLKGL